MEPFERQYMKDHPGLITEEDYNNEKDRKKKRDF